MNHEVKILLVEDSEGDIILITQALKKAQVTNSITVLKDGDEALKYLAKKPPYEDVDTPDLVLLDINLPKIDGIEVLAELKKDEALLSIPVVMLTTSESEKDVVNSYNNHANCYIVKPVDFKKFMDVVQLIKEFWITVVKLPKH
jgi:two-component system, chemotaxis family, response regulator Rcp1